MLNRDKNKIFEAVKTGGFSPEDFVADNQIIGGHGVFSLTHRFSDFKFRFAPSPQSFEEFKLSHTLLAPSFPLSKWLPQSGHLAFDECTHHLIIWLRGPLNVFLADQMIPDRWAEARGQAELIGSTVPAPDRVFGLEEKEQIRISLAHVQRLITENFSPTKVQQQLITERLDYLSSAVDRLSKFDWNSVLLSTMIGIATNLSLDTERGAVLMGIFKQAFSGVVHLLR